MNRWRLLALGAALAATSVACSAATRRKALELFFDGVPPLGANGPAAAGGASPGAAASPVVVDHEHGPYAARMCDGCHETGKSNALVAGRDELCARCHRLALEKRFVHGPLVAGGCLLCHDPHRSRYPALLVSDSAAFCARCHDRAALRPVEGHGAGGATCTSCHEAHMSDRRFLLK